MGDIKKKIGLTLIVLFLLAVLYRLHVPCPILYLLNIPCPGCGMTRAVVSLLSFHIREALLFHPMVWSLPFLYLAFLMDGKIFSARWANILFYTVIGLGFFLHWMGNLVVFC